MQGGSYHEPDKSNVLLTELVIVILFFALTAVTVMQLFVAAHQKSQNNVLINKASIVAQDIAEQLSGERNPEGVLFENKYEKGEAEGEYMRRINDDLFVVRISEEKAEAGVLVISKIEIFNDGQTRAQYVKKQVDANTAASAPPQPLISLTTITYCADDGAEVSAQ